MAIILYIVVQFAHHGQPTNFICDLPVLKRITHPPSTKKTTENLTWLDLKFSARGRKRRTLNLLLTQHGFRFPLLSFGEGCNLSAFLRQYVPYIWPYGRINRGARVPEVPVKNVKATFFPRRLLR